MEDFADKLWWLFFLLLWVVPRVYKLFTKRRAASPVLPRPAPAEDFDPEPLVEAFDLAPTTSSAPRPDPAAADRLLDRARAVHGRVTELVHRCRLHRGAATRLLPTLEERGRQPLDAVIARLEERRAAGGPSLRETAHLESEIARIEGELALVAQVIEQRVRLDHAELLDLLDLPAQDCLTPYLVHARRLDLPFTADRAVVLVDPTGAAEAPWLADPDLAPVVLEESALERPAAWAEIAPQIAWSVLRSTPGLAPQLGRAIGVPDPGAAIAYFQTTGRLGFTTLAAGWLSRIVVDACAAVQLGPAFAAHLALIGRGSEERAAALQAWIDDRFRFGPPPAHVRMFAVCHALDRLGFADEAQARWQRWRSDLGDPEVISLVSTRFPPIRLPLDRVLEAVGGLVDGVLEQPLAALGGYPLGQIPGLAGDAGDFAAMAALARRLAAGEVPNASPRLILGGLTLALERSGHLEQRIRKAALGALAGKGEPAPSRGALPGAVPADLGAALSDPGFVAAAVALGAALTPARGGRTPRLA